ncbi:hypothetical protein SDC9_207389 [bioreactor metagenome]|uniref:Uncharacterized protein n=1 Tax=bioreactor metagenome TaxID=1076179 RepID=A0A645J8F7_9ZZZZ
MNLGVPLHPGPQAGIRFAVRPRPAVAVRERDQSQPTPSAVVDGLHLHVVVGGQHQRVGRGPGEVVLTDPSGRDPVRAHRLLQPLLFEVVALG